MKDLRPVTHEKERKSMSMRKSPKDGMKVPQALEETNNNWCIRCFSKATPPFSVAKLLMGGPQTESNVPYTPKVNTTVAAIPPK